MDDLLAPLGDAWCSCADAPWRASGAATLLDHAPGCGFPERACDVAAHRTTVHAGCGRPLPWRYCGCGPSGYTLDVERGWWVCYVCGWPTRAWLAAAGSAPPARLLGLRPVTYHDFPAIPRSPKAVFERLTDEQRRVNAAWTGRPVRD